MQIGDRDVGRKEEVHAGPVDECLPVGGKFNDPALVEFDGGLEDVAHFLRKVLTVRHGAVMGDDVGPDVIRVEAALCELGLEKAVLHDVGAGDRILTVDVGTIGLDRGTVPPMMRDEEALGATAMRCEKRRMTPESAASGQAALGAQARVSLFDRCGDVPEHVAVRELGGGGLEGDAALLQIGVKAHGAEAHAALAHRSSARGGCRRARAR